MESPDFFAPVPLSMDPQTKAVTLTASQPNPELSLELQRLNTMHRSLLQLDPPSLTTPPPPNAVNQKRSQQVIKMRETAQSALNKKTASQATLATPSAGASTAQPSSEPVKLFTLAIDMAKQRPEWEAAGLRREELASLYRGRAEAFIALRAWPDALIDARISLECKPKANAGALAKASRALVEMGLPNDARTLIAPVINEEINGLDQARQQVGQIPANHPQLAQAKAQIEAFSKDIEELKAVARELDVSFG